MGEPRLLGPAEVRALAAQLGVAPTKKLGQNFVHDPNTVRKIVRLAGVGAGDPPAVLEVGPGLGSLTLGLLEQGVAVTAIEIDDRLAAALPATAERFQPGCRLAVIHADALAVTRAEIAARSPGGQPPTALVANLPYNVGVPILLHLLAECPELTSGLVMVQQEVGERLAAAVGSRVYGAPTVKAAWYGRWELAGTVSRQIFWPVPNVDSALVRFTARATPLGSETEREAVFRLINAAFLQRRKMLRQSLKTELRDAAETLRRAGIDPTARAEALGVVEYLTISRAAQAEGTLST